MAGVFDGWPRPARIAAIARQDLAHELKGRQGLLLPIIMTGLLLPASTVSSPLPDVADPLKELQVSVHGDVPAEVNGASEVVPFDRTRIHLRFYQQPDVLLVDGPVIPASVRAALDGASPVVVVETTPRGYLLPGRTALLSLIAASTLTGAVAQSIGGERSRKTLGVLLAAAVTRAEIVLGKWLAWGGFGAGAALLGAAIAVVAGRVAPGAWMIALPTVPLATVALGLWLVRGATDVMAGSATALRVLPAALSICGIVAWLLGDRSPYLGAAVPLGGALLAAGATWPSTGATLLAAATTLGFAGVMIAGTIRDLEEVPDKGSGEDPNTLALAVGALAVCAWWLPVGGPQLWTSAGNPKITAALDPAWGAAAGALALLTLSVSIALRSTAPLAPALGLPASDRGVRGVVRDIAAGLVAGVASAALVAGIGAVPALSGHGRFVDALGPSPAFGPGVGLLVIVADELVFRGWLQRRAGAWRALAVWTVVKAPFAPVLGLAAGLGPAVVAARGGSAWPAIVARLVAWGIAWAITGAGMP